jgi:hypothetical protein
MAAELEKKYKRRHIVSLALCWVARVGTRMNRMAACFTIASKQTSFPLFSTLRNRRFQVASTLKNSVFVEKETFGRLKSDVKNELFASACASAPRGLKLRQKVILSSSADSPRIKPALQAWIHGPRRPDRHREPQAHEWLKHASGPERSACSDTPLISR